MTQREHHRPADTAVADPERQAAAARRAGRAPGRQASCSRCFPERSRRERELHPRSARLRDHLALAEQVERCRRLRLHVQAGRGLHGGRDQRRHLPIVARLGRPVSRRVVAAPRSWPRPSSRPSGCSPMTPVGACFSTSATSASEATDATDGSADRGHPRRVPQFDGRRGARDRDQRRRDDRGRRAGARDRPRGPQPARRVDHRRLVPVQRPCPLLRSPAAAVRAVLERRSGHARQRDASRSPGTHCGATSPRPRATSSSSSATWPPAAAPCPRRSRSPVSTRTAAAGRPIPRCTAAAASTSGSSDMRAATSPGAATGYDYPASGCPVTGTNSYFGSGFGSAPNDVCLTDSELRAEVAKMIYQTGLAGHTQAGTHPAARAAAAPGRRDCLDAAGTVCSANGAPATHAQFCSYHSQVSVGGAEYSYVVQPWTASRPRLRSTATSPTPTPINFPIPVDQLANDIGQRLVSPLEPGHARRDHQSAAERLVALDGSEINDNGGLGCQRLAGQASVHTAEQRPRLGDQSAQNTYLLQREFNNAGRDRERPERACRARQRRTWLDASSCRAPSTAATSCSSTARRPSPR